MWSAVCQTHKTNLWRSYSATQLHTQNNNNKRFFSQSPFITFIYLREEKKIFHCNNDRDFFTEKGENIYFLFHCWSRFPFRWFSSSFALVYLFTYFYRRFLVNFIYFSRKALRRKMISIPPVDLSSTSGKKRGRGYTMTLFGNIYVLRFRFSLTRWKNTLLVMQIWEIRLECNLLLFYIKWIEGSGYCCCYFLLYK